MNPLTEKKYIFSLNISRLIGYAYEKGFTIIGKEWFRPDWVAAEYAHKGVGILHSPHCNSIALDLYLYKDGNEAAIEGYAMIADFWHGLNPDNRWGGLKKDGGDFTSKDDRWHFSMQYNGVM